MGFWQRRKAYSIGCQTAEVMVDSCAAVFAKFQDEGKTIVRGEVAAQTLKCRQFWDVLPDGGITWMEVPVATKLGPTAREHLVTQIQSETGLEVIYTVVSAEFNHDYDGDSRMISAGLRGAVDYIKGHGLVIPDP
jgi:hypothetical protein